MITEQEILDLGFRIFGIDDEDPFYKIIFKKTVFGKQELSGNFNNKGEFEIYSANKSYSDINEIKLLFMTCGFEINRELTNNYGSDKSIRDEEYHDKQNSISINEFVIDLLRISEEKRKLPLVIQAPNKMLFSPQIKMIFKEGTMLTENAEIEQMIITY